MTKRYSYADAAKLLGAPPRLIQMLDKISTVALLGGSLAAPAAVLSLFDARSEAIRMGNELHSSLRDKLGLVTPHERVDILRAAHSILVLTAYFNVFEKARLPVAMKDLEITKLEQRRLAAGHELRHRDSLVDLVTTKFIPGPTPGIAYETTRGELHEFYKQLSNRLQFFIEGLNVADRLNQTKWDALTQGIGALPAAALLEYDALFRRLAAEFTEFFIWANLNQHHATRAAIQDAGHAANERLEKLFEVSDQLRTGLGAVEMILSRTGFRSSSYARSSLAIVSRAELDWPIVNRTDFNAQPQIEFPRLRDGYVNPSGRAAQLGIDDSPGNESWWDGCATIKDLQVMLAGLVSKADAPTVILGQPGSGKSLLTRVLAARLAEAGILALRVELRHVPADAPIQNQIEEGIYRLTGERISWPDFVRQADEAPRLVLLDGLDELIQASQVHRADYLELVHEFQKREDLLGRPTAVIVTSRTVVAARTRFPANSVAIRLDPFDDFQVGLWLERWASANQEYFRSAGVRPLSAEHAVRQGELARQPLLLLMLTLYDSEDNRLQSTTEQLASADLYEGLLARFARREVLSRDEHVRTRSTESISPAIEHEIQRLSVIAAGMFNRSQQWISAEEVDKDLVSLLRQPNAEHPTGTSTRFHEQISEAEFTIARFFFIQESRMRGTASRRTYEFLHPTFGEYLVARLILQATRRYSDRASFEASSVFGPSKPDDGLLFSLLSFELVTARSPVLHFVRELSASISSSECDRIRDALVVALQDALDYRSDRGQSSYRPRDLPFTERVAIYSANLVVLVIHFSAKPVNGNDLFPGSTDAIEAWRRHYLLWKSQLGYSAAWMPLMNYFAVSRGYDHDGSRSLTISERRRGEPPTTTDNLAWGLGFTSGERDDDDTGVLTSYFQINNLNFIYGLGKQLDSAADSVLDMIQPLIQSGNNIGYILYPDNVVETAVRAALRVVVVSSGDNIGELQDAYIKCIGLTAVLEGRKGHMSPIGRIVLRLLRADAHRLPQDFVKDWLRKALDSSVPGSAAHLEISQLQSELLAEADE